MNCPNDRYVNDSAICQAVAANLNPWTEVKVDHENAYRGPLLVTADGKTRTTVATSVGQCLIGVPLQRRPRSSSLRLHVVLTR